jgi:hypothetical protein
LVEGGRVETVRTNFELDDKDDSGRDQHQIGTLSHARNRELKGNPAVEATKLRLREVDLI